MGPGLCFFASDLHGREERYRALFRAIRRERPTAVLLGGDLLPHRWTRSSGGLSALGVGVRGLRRELGDAAPRILLILGNDDERAAEPMVETGAREGLWEYVHHRVAPLGDHLVVGYSYVPPTPFLLKDWERHDVGRFVDPGCVPPDEGYRSVEVDLAEIRERTIAGDLAELTAGLDGDRLVLLAHSPPYRTALDRAALDGRSVDGAPIDPHVGSIALRRFIEDRQPLLTLHGHIHESARITGAWRDAIGRTHCLSAAHDGPELALVRFDLDDLEGASRELA